MADAKKCDRCGIYYERADMEENVYYMRWVDGYKSDRIDLCPSCLKAMDRFLKCESTVFHNSTRINYSEECGGKHSHEHKE